MQAIEVLKIAVKIGGTSRLVLILLHGWLKLIHTPTLASSPGLPIVQVLMVRTLNGQKLDSGHEAMML